MPSKYKTSLYIANVNLQSFPKLIDLRSCVWKLLKEKLSHVENLVFNEEEQNITFNETPITFRIRYLPREREILLSFFPYDQRVATWGKSENEKAIKDIIQFCDIVGDTISVTTDGVALAFKRALMDTLLDIANWEVVLTSTEPTEKYDLSEFLNKKVETQYNLVLNRLPKNAKFFIFTQTFLDNKKPYNIQIIETLKTLLHNFGEVRGPKSLLSAKTFGEKYYNSGTPFVFIFVENASLLQQWYKTQKIYFDNNKIPTQFIKDEVILNKLKQLPGVKTNLILEIMTKMGKKPLLLRAPEEIITSEGFLCLSDIKGITRNLFGALFTYSKEGSQKEEEIQIYEDINFTANKNKIDIPTSDIEILADRISDLIGKKMVIDIILTKEWQKKKLEELISKLKEKEINVKKVYYVSSKTSRFIDDYIISESAEKTKFPYLKIADKIAFLRTSTKVRIYANLFSLFIKLSYPENEVLEERDLKKILWLVKKRVYRIQEFEVLKIPEPMHIFKDIRKMYLGEVKGRLSIPLRLLI